MSLVLAVLSLASVLIGFADPEYTEIAFIGMFVLGPLAILLGAIGWSRAGDVGSGDSSAVAGIGIGLATFVMVCACFAPSISRVSEPGRRAQFTNNLKQISVAVHNYADIHGALPPPVVRDRSGRPLYSWRVLILPYLEAKPLYQEFHLEEPWDSPHNRTLLEKAPNPYQAIDPKIDPQLTHIQAFVGPGTAFEESAGRTLTTANPNADFPDGLANTALVVEARNPVPWSAPQDIPFGPGVPIPPLGGGYRRDRAFFRLSPKIGAFAMLMADGSVKTARTNKLPEATLRALVTRNGGEVIPPGEY
jgi:hypothetical protein